MPTKEPEGTGFGDFGVFAPDGLSDALMGVGTQHVIHAARCFAVGQIDLLKNADVGHEKYRCRFFFFLHLPDEAFYFLIDGVKDNAFAEAGVLADRHIGVVDADECQFDAFNFGGPVGCKQRFPAVFVLHVLYNDVGVVGVHDFQHDVFAVNYLPVAGLQQVVAHFPYDGRKEAPLRAGCVSAALNQVARIDDEGAARVFRFFAVEEGFDVGQSAPLTKNQLPVFDKELVVGIELTVDVGGL